ncbi:hypothetical protein HPP92_005616 [Vanilla planifolia]|uniref:Uncharacterized protein n=1 Tax=Vanilla planifolia TaxID=51239 RepID=A0A835VCC5_VANPL|nr:hypothetical protein HPP92_005616 [Vanilla planifolia]
MAAATPQLPTTWKDAGATASYSMNTTSQIALSSGRICPIESLDFPVRIIRPFLSIVG